MSAADQTEIVDGLLAPTLPGTLGVTPRERALLGYADQLTTAPMTIGRSDLDRLRAEGLDDRAIHDTCAIIAYFAFVNRIADGLGVDLEGNAG